MEGKGSYKLRFFRELCEKIGPSPFSPRRIRLSAERGEVLNFILSLEGRGEGEGV